MKRKVSILMLLLLGILAIGTAQKTVAVWDITVVKGSEEVSALRRSQIQSALETGIQKSAEYRPFARASLDKIKEERGFQASGEVSDKEIREVGKLAGVDFVLQTEAAKEGNEMNINVKVLNMKTGEYDNAAKVYIENVLGKELETQCTKLAIALFGSSNKIENIPAGFVDLGLSSGVKWKKFNSGMYSYDDAVAKFGNSLPTMEQWEELRNECQWSWTTVNNNLGYNVTGPNGNSIFLPAAGYRDCDGSVSSVGSGGFYWSSEPRGSSDAWYLLFTSSNVYMSSYSRCRGRSVRLVQE